MDKLGPVLLAGPHVRLEPVREHHTPGLTQAAASPEIWDWLYSDMSKPDMVQKFVAAAIAEETAGSAFPFAVVLQETGRVVGSSRYQAVDTHSRTVEIGFTWYAPDVWGSKVNLESKFLLLTHAFESWGAMRVQLKADPMNERSLAAIKKIGATYEGTMRKTRLRRDGTVRDTAMFSIIDQEWPATKASLLQRLHT